MNQKDLTKTFIMIANGKNPLVSKVFIKKFSALRVDIYPRVIRVSLTEMFFGSNVNIESSPLVACLLIM